MSAQVLYKELFDTISRNRNNLIAFGEDIWKHPECGYREFRTSGLAQMKLKTLGLSPKSGLAITGFRADIDTGRPGPTVALLGEMDALRVPDHPEADPQTGAVHACGHNTHITSLIGAAEGLVKSGILKYCCGKIALIGVPAEESIEQEVRDRLQAEGKIHFRNGKPELIYNGVFDDVDIAVMNHLGGNFSVNDFNGNIRKKVIFHGKSFHAALPESGINAMSAANLALHALALVRDFWSNDPYVRVHGIITHAGDAVNVIPGEVSMSYMLRSGSLEMFKKINDTFDRAVNGAAYSMGAVCEIISEHGSAPLKNSDALCEIYRSCVHELSPESPVDIKGHYQPGCTDMGDVSMILPALHGYYPGGDGGCHCADFRIKDPDTAYVLSSKLLAAIAVELLSDNAAKGRRIAEEKNGKMSIADYIKWADGLRNHSFFPE